MADKPMESPFLPEGPRIEDHFDGSPAELIGIKRPKPTEKDLVKAKKLVKKIMETE